MADANCSSCGELHSRLRPDGRHQAYCKACHAAHMRATRPKHCELDPAARKRANARSYANVCLSRGQIQRGPCVECGHEPAQMHHDDYDKPAEVVWLCRPCHLKRHAAEKCGKGNRKIDTWNIDSREMLLPHSPP